MQPHLTFVHITDTHLGPGWDVDFYGYRPARQLQRLVALINDFEHQPDFVLHTGDLTNDASDAATALAQAILSDLRAPLVLVNGNHDNPALLRKHFDVPFGGEPDTPMDYAFNLNGERFVVLDAHNPAEARDPLGKLRPSQLDGLRAECVPDGPPLTILIHYPPFPMGSPWLDENMILVNGDAFHSVLLPARDRLRGVFFGHLHRSCQVVRDGIRYTSAGSAVMQYAWRSWDRRPQIDADFAPAYNVAQYFADTVIVTQRGYGLA